MNDIDFFDNIDLKDVSKRTLIDLKELDYLKNEEFDKLSKAKGLGFIKIIEREYKIDLSDKKKKFLEYLKTNNKDNNNELFIAPPKTSFKTFPKVIALLLILLIIVGIAYIWYTNHINNSTEVEIMPQKNQIIQEAKKISGIDTTTDKAVANETNKTDKNITILKSSEIISQNLSVIAKENNLSIQNSNKTKTLKLSKNNLNSIKISTQNGNKNKKEKIVDKQSFIIIPRKRIWVGIVDLSNYKKSSYIKDSNITINKNNNFLVTTGHGKFNIFYKGQIIKFDTVNPVKLLIKDGKVMQIDKKEFVKLNKGKYW